MTRKKAPKKKLEIVFDDKKRREFLTGFQKRKNERRKRAKEELERNLKEERKRIRQEIKEGVKHMKKSYEPLKELTSADKANEDEYEDDDVKVKIVELTTKEIAAQRHMLGENFSQEAECNESEETSNDEEDMEKCANSIPGMDFDINSKRKHESEEIEIETKNYNIPNLKTKKELDHFKKTKTLKKLKKSKVFKMKERIDKKVNQKKVRKDKYNTLRNLPKHVRRNKKFEKCTYNKGRKMNKKQIRKKFEN